MGTLAGDLLSYIWFSEPVVSSLGHISDEPDPKDICGEWMACIAVHICIQLCFVDEEVLGGDVPFSLSIVWEGN